ncbi:3-hydroxyacyl-CoA dehydrogenase [Meiothermus sp. PNK-Is4]|nr:3-hydroxybutyryl-CoA dehydrogenase [Meiothermus sp. Pnk-1]RYM32216.1 3-hydroxyacyl-CoA dehydrogenase [Meiothermus sp. PNK-Is4]
MGREMVAILGAGTMGRGIAQVAAQAGHPVWLYDPSQEALERAKAEIAADLSRQAERGRLRENPEAILERIQTAHELSGQMAEAAWVIEAAPERLELKQTLLAQAAQIAPAAILATNTSTLSVSAIAAACPQPERVIGLHFFNPAPRMRLVEVIPGLRTAPEVVHKALELARSWGKEPVQAADMPGFLVNRVARPFYGEALRLYGEGIPKEHIDWIAKGLGFPMGPFELMDLIGLDVNLAASRSVYEGFFGEPRYRPHPLQAQRVAAGMLGRKSGVGWYTYPPGPPPLPEAPSANLEQAPTAFIVGPHPLAQSLRQRYRHTEEPAQADFILDCRVKLERKGNLPERLPVVTLVWGHSASAAAEAYPDRPVAGFSLVPPLSEGNIAEVYAPISGENAAVRLAQRYFQAHGHRVLELPDQPGGVGFRILALLINEAVSAVAEGLATPADLDRAMRLGTGYPRGPLEWAEAIWLKPVLRALEGLHGELGEDRYRPHPLLQRMVATGSESFSGRHWNSSVQGGNP